MKPRATRPRIALMLCLALAAVCGMLAACGGAQATPTVSALDAGQIHIVATPTRTPDPLLLRNAALLGCHPSAPAPQSNVLWTGLKPGDPGPVPREVALTFDDGPTPYTSPPILDILEKTHTPATFFVEGQYIHTWPYLLRREWQDGFAVALHTWDHPLMSKLTATQMRHQFGDTLAEMRGILGARACVWLWRPPYADYNQAVLKMAASYGLTTVTWDDSSDDWDRPGVSKIVDNVLSNAHPGAIVLMHDGPALREQTAAALPEILAGLRERGLVPVTLPKLLADGHYPGVAVSGS
jgi:peptidoglycan-N-acetylglucosamine deacetylase